MKGVCGCDIHPKEHTFHLLSATRAWTNRCFLAQHPQPCQSELGIKRCVRRVCVCVGQINDCMNGCIETIQHFLHCLFLRQWQKKFHLLISCSFSVFHYFNANKSQSAFLPGIQWTTTCSNSSSRYMSEMMMYNWNPYWVCWKSLTVWLDGGPGSWRQHFLLPWAKRSRRRHKIFWNVNRLFIMPLIFLVVCCQHLQARINRQISSASVNVKVLQNICFCHNRYEHTHIFARSP